MKETAATLTTIAIFILALFSVDAVSQLAKLPAVKATRVNLYHHLGSVELPQGFRGRVTANWTDAWAGILETRSPRMEIGCRAGTIQYVGEDKKRNKDIVWERVEKTTEFPIKLTLFRDKRGDTLVARIDWMEFSVELGGQADEEIFMSVVRSYQRQRCATCRYLPVRSIY